MIIPLIRIQQNNDYIYTSRMTIGDLKKRVKLTFRHHYIEEDNHVKHKNFMDYIQRFKRSNIKVEYNEHMIQRRLQIERLNNISQYIQNENNIIPNSIILACYNKRIELGESNLGYIDTIKKIDEKLGLFSIDINEDFEMTIIDGQHRLAGYFSSDNKEVDKIELPIVILFGPSLSTSAKIFVDINGNQKAVDKSLIYDLTEVLEEEFDTNKLKEKEIKEIRNCHNIINALYRDENSPLYKSIRMLGTGNGMVSQGFLVELIYPIICKGELKGYAVQEQLDAIYIFLKAIQEVFQEDWPILNDCRNNRKQREQWDLVIKKKKSQLPKTLGLSSIFYNFNDLFIKCGFEYEKYIECLARVKETVCWNRMEYNSRLEDQQFTGQNEIIFIEGTNKAKIGELSNIINKIIDSVN